MAIDNRLRAQMWTPLLRPAWTSSSEFVWTWQCENIIIILFIEYYYFIIATRSISFFDEISFIQV